MKSPRRPALAQRNGRDMLLCDQAYLVQKEKERRRLLRLQQVRLISAENARVVRQRVRREQLRQIRKIAHNEVERYKEEKTRELNKLETEYQNALRDIGLGHEGLAEQREFEHWKGEQIKQQCQVAEIRGDHATNVVKHQQMLTDKLHEEKTKLKKSVRLTEDARAAELRARRTITGSGFTLAKVTEIDPYEDHDESMKKRVHFSVGRERRDPNINVRALGKDAIGAKPGVEAAIREEENQPQLTLEQRRAARMRGVAAIKRAKMQQQRITASYFDDSESDTEASMTVHATVEQRTRTDYDDDIDLIPSRGPSASSTIDGSGNTSPGSSLHAAVCRYPTNAEGRPVMGGPSSAFTVGGSSERQQAVQVIGRPTGTKSQQTGLSQPDSRPTKKSQLHDEDFIVKVLEGFELIRDEGGIQVDVNVEEVSTLHSVTSSSSMGGSESQRLRTRQSTSSTDITQERFWQAEDIHGLIGQLRNEPPIADGGKLVEQTRLRGYIEKLLRMKREEIADMSVTSTDQSSSTPTSSSSGTSNNRSKFTSSTPASILSSSDGSKSSLSKTVRFQDDEDTRDGSFRPREQSLSDSEEKKRKEILEKTRESLEKVQAYYEEQRKLLETALEKRRSGKENVAPLSEGPLSSSSSSSVHSQGSKDKTGRRSSSSAKDSSGNEMESSSKKSVVRRTHTSSLSRQHQQSSRFLNKSSSSGTTTSGSVATAELLSRLRQLQLPTLERPPLPAARRLTLPTAREEDDLNTSADLLKAPDLESSPVEGALLVKSKHSTVTTFNFSSDDESLADISKEKQLDYITLSSISSNSDH